MNLGKNKHINKNLFKDEGQNMSMIDQTIIISSILNTLLTFVMWSALITSVANICLLAGMLYVYLERYLKVKSKFTATLVLFALLFLLQNILFLVYFLYNIPQTVINAMILLIFLGLEFIAFCMFLMITKE